MNLHLGSHIPSAVGAIGDAVNTGVNAVGSVAQTINSSKANADQEASKTSLAGDPETAAQNDALAAQQAASARNIAFESQQSIETENQNTINSVMAMKLDSTNKMIGSLASSGKAIQY